MNDEELEHGDILWQKLLLAAAALHVKEGALEYLKLLRAIADYEEHYSDRKRAL